MQQASTEANRCDRLRDTLPKSGKPSLKPSNDSDPDLQGAIVSIEVVKKVIREFLVRERYEVLALKGDWGVGKTYAWKALISEPTQKHWPANYAYVSLFGLSSLAELRIAIISSRYAPNSTVAESAGGLKSFADSLPAWFKAIGTGIDVLAPALVKDLLICIDDFERLNTSKLTHDQVLGFISNLKESARCKIVLILNDEKLEGADHPYRKYREKVVDQELQFAPTSEEATQWGLPAFLPHRTKVKSLTISLEISNVRVLRKISKVVEILAPSLEKLHPAVVDETLNSAVLLAWCYYDRSGKTPELEFVRSWNWMVSALKEETKKARTPAQESWAAQLNEYGFRQFDEFDAAILKVIEQGYLDESGFPAQAIERDEMVRAGDLESGFRSAWRLFHDSFEHNETELIGALETSFRKGVLFISPVNLNGLVALLRELGRGALADELISYYIDQHLSHSKLFALEQYALANEVTDTKIREAFAAQTAANAANISLQEAVEAITRGSWSPEHTSAIAAAGPADFYQVFTGKLSVSRRKAIEACLAFTSAPNVAAKATAALQTIAAESPLNAARVRRFGVSVPSTPGSTPPVT